MQDTSPCCAPDRPTSPADVTPSHSTIVSKGTGSTKGMVGLPGGEFLMGTDDELGFPADGEGPIRRITLKPFYIDETSVTNAQFTRFVKSTRYQTEAEQFGWSFVFHLFLTKRARREATHAVTEVPWWLRVNGATWRHPEGPGSGVKDRMDHPTVHISWNDAMSYSEWAGKRLATEAEWEFSARGGLEQRRYAWGDELTPGGEHRCNIWQGDFPNRDTGEDGYSGTAPARSYEPNNYGLYNVAGNVWEWTADWFSADHHVDARATTRRARRKAIHERLAADHTSATNRTAIVTGSLHAVRARPIARPAIWGSAAPSTPESAAMVKRGSARRPVSRVLFPTFDQFTPRRGGASSRS